MTATTDSPTLLLLALSSADAASWCTEHPELSDDVFVVTPSNYRTALHGVAVSEILVTDDVRHSHVFGGMLAEATWARNKSDYRDIRAFQIGAADPALAVA